MVLGRNIKYQILLDSIEIPILVLEKDFSIMYCNRAYAQLYGKMSVDLIGQNLLKLFPEKIGTPSHISYLNVLDTDKKEIVEIRLGNCCFNEHIYRTPTGVLSMIQEMPSDSHREESVQLSITGHRNIFDEANDAIFIYDVYNTRIIDANKTACDMFRYEREDLLSLHAGDLSIDESPYTQDIFIQWIKRSSDMRSQHMEWKCRDSAGRIFWTEVKSKRIIIDNNMRLVVFIRDITERKYVEKELCDIHNRYHDLFENPADFVFTHDLGGNFISVNQRAEVITGYQTEELVKMNIQDLATKQYVNVLRAFQYQRLPKDQSTAYELGIHTKFATEIILDVNIWPIYRAGKPIAIQGIARNITNRKLLEAKLKTSEQRLTSFIDYLPDATMAIDLQGKVVVWNQAMVELTGVKAEDMLGKGNYEYGLAFYNKRRPIMVDLVLRPDEVKQYYSIIEVDKYTVISEFDTPSLRGEGHYLWGQAMPWFDANGNLIGAIESLRDITERYKRRHSLQESEEEVENKCRFLNALIDNLNGPSCTFNTNGQIIITNEGFKKLFGYDKGDLYGKNISDIIAEKDQKIFSQEGLADLLKNGGSSFEVSFCTKTGAVSLLKVNISPLLENKEVIGGIIRA